MGCGAPGEMVDLYKKILANQFEEAEQNGTDGSSDGKKPVQMVTTWKKELNLNPACEPYGDGRAEIVDFAVVDHKDVISNLVMKERNFEIRMKIRFKETIDHPIFAFTIKDKKGTELTGTNTFIED